MEETVAEAAYGALLSGIDPADFSGALRQVLLSTVLRRPGRVPSALADLSLRQGRVALRTLRQALGESPQSALPAGDRRFADRAWQENPLLRGLAEGYLDLSDWARTLVETAPAPRRVRDKAGFATRMALDAASPSNIPWVNPSVLKEALDTGGRSLVMGLVNFVEDLAHNGGRPRQVDASAFEVGGNLAATPGRVVFRNSLIELIAYEPQTDLVHAQPVLCSPPWINRYYIMDLAPGRSFVEYMVRQGFTVFMISYRNPEASMAELSWDDYLRSGVLTALDQVQALTDAQTVNLVGLCLGGTMSTLALAHLAARGDAARVGWMALTNTLVDFSLPGELGVFTEPQTVARLEKRMRRQGYLDGGSLARTFDSLRANDLIWNYVVDGWYMGKRPPAFDILAWNQHSTNMPAAMHSQYLQACYVDNSLVRPNAFRLAGTPIDLRRITHPLYVLSAVADHITPWRGGYLTTQRVGGDVHFTLSSSGHIAGIVNPPGNPRSEYWTRETAERGMDAERWLAGTERFSGTWWDDWRAWAAPRSGEMVPPPQLPAGEAAPGGYVVDRIGPPLDLVAPVTSSNGHHPARATRSATRRTAPNGRRAPRGAARR